jgi:hypothetical protein
MLRCSPPYQLTKPVCQFWLASIRRSLKLIRAPLILEKAVEAVASWSSVPKFKVFLAVFK